MGNCSFVPEKIVRYFFHEYIAKEINVIQQLVLAGI